MPGNGCRGCRAGEGEGGRGRESKEEPGERQGKFLAGNQVCFMILDAELRWAQGCQMYTCLKWLCDAGRNIPCEPEDGDRGLSLWRFFQMGIITSEWGMGQSASYLSISGVLLSLHPQAPGSIWVIVKFMCLAFLRWPSIFPGVVIHWHK